MRTKLFVIILSFLFLSSAILLVAQEKQEKKQDKKVKVEKTKVSKESKMTESKSTDKKYWCPVMNMQGKKEINYKYKRKTYYFCCKDCLAKFKKEPEKYASK